MVSWISWSIQKSERQSGISSSVFQLSASTYTVFHLFPREAGSLLRQQRAVMSVIWHRCFMCVTLGYTPFQTAGIGSCVCSLWASLVFHHQRHTVATNTAVLWFLPYLDHLPFKMDSGSKEDPPLHHSHGFKREMMMIIEQNIKL